jgi:hypothetical protein
MVLLAAGGAAAAVKLTQRDAQRIEQHAGAPVEELTEEELVAAMRDLGIKSIELDDQDRAIVAGQNDQPPTQTYPVPDEPEPSYLDELERLAALRDRGVISDEDFEAKKRQLLDLGEL